MQRTHLFLFNLVGLYNKKGRKFETVFKLYYEKITKAFASDIRIIFFKSEERMCIM
jgi:hypothetical protein